nr:terpene synthase-like protein uBuTS-8 [Bubarida sp. uBuTS-8]
MSLSTFAKIPVPELELEHQMHYADSIVSVTKLREPSVSKELKSRLHRRVLELRLNPQNIEILNSYDFVAKVCTFGVSNHSTTCSHQNRWWIFASISVIFLFEFDDQFDKPLLLSPENIASLSKKMRGVLRSLSGHKLSGLQGNLEDWPAEVVGKEAYLWLLREAEDLREGAAELVQDLFVDYCYGTEEEIIEWQPDAYRGDYTAWNLDRYNEVRKRSAGLTFVSVGPLFVAHKWIQKKHVVTCTDLLYEATIVIALANDILGVNRDRDDRLCVTSLKLSSCSEVVQYHNELVEVLHKKVLELEGNTRRFMEEVEASVVGLFLWQCRSKRYAVVFEC